MLDGTQDTADFHVQPPGRHFDPTNSHHSSAALDALLADLISHQPEISLETLPREIAAEEVTGPAHLDAFSALDEAVPDRSRFQHIEVSESNRVDIVATKTSASLDVAETTLIAKTGAAEPARQMLRIYSVGDLGLFERLTGYRLVAQRQLWRSVDKDGNRSMAADRLFTVLAEEAFQLADRHRRSGLSPHADLTVIDIATAMTPLRKIAAHLGGRGTEAFERLRAALMALPEGRFMA